MAGRGTRRTAGAFALRNRSQGRKPRTGAPVELVVDGMPVHLVRKRIKNVNLRVLPPDGRVEVSAPAHVSEHMVASFVREKQAWIKEHQAMIAASPTALAAAATPEQVDEWGTVVRALVPGLITRWEAVIGVKAGVLAYRNMSSRWGSCNPQTGRICINVRLALYPPECLEYVVVHELCHLRERGHGPAFKALLDCYLPDWRSRRAKLR